MSLQCTVLANCGLLLSCEGGSLLVDAPNHPHSGFDCVSDSETELMAQELSPYNHLCGAIFTHRHPDHYSRTRLDILLHGRSDFAVFTPNGSSQEKGRLSLGPFLVRYFTASHSGEEYADVPHCVFLVECGTSRLYITGDADWKDPIHERVISSFHPTVGFWNPNYLFHEDGRALLKQLPKNVIYHLPVSAPDRFGIGRKCNTDYQRYRDELPGTVLSGQIPPVLML